jgi:hypothetical protein
LLNPKYLDQIFDVSISRGVTEDEYQKNHYEKYYGKLEISSDEELLQMRKNKEKSIIEEYNLILDLTENEEIAYWFDVLKTNESYAKNKQIPWITTFFELIGDDEKYIQSRYKKMSADFIYINYETNALITHASTIRNIMYLTQDKAIPKINVSEDSIKSTAKSISDMSTTIMVMLAALKSLI